MIRSMTVLDGSHGPAEMPSDHSHSGQGSQRSEVKGPRIPAAFYSAPRTAVFLVLILRSHTQLLRTSWWCLTAWGTLGEAGGDRA